MVKIINYNNTDRYENENIKVVNYNNAEKYEKERKEDQNIQLFISAINTNNLECLDQILDNNKNIIYEMYKRNNLTPERLEYILKKKNKTIVLPILLIKNLIKKNKIELLNVLFKYSKIYDSDIILEFCYLRKYKKPISTSELNNKINNEKYKIEINQEGHYLLDACQKNHEHIIKYLVEYGTNVNQKKIQMMNFLKPL